MSHDANSAEYQPLAPLNTLGGRTPHGLKSRKANKPLKENKPAMEVCDVTLDEVVDLELAGRLTATAIEQFLFFLNQVPFPVSRLAKLPTSNDKNRRLRNDFINAHKKLLQDMRSGLSTLSSISGEDSSHAIQVVITLGSIMMPRATMLFQMPGIEKDLTKRPPIVENQLSGVTIPGDEPPPDSDSDPEDGSSSSGNPANTVKESTVSTPAIGSVFVPFQDTDPVIGPSEGSPSTPPARRKVLTGRRSGLSNVPRTSEVADENQTSKARLDKRFRTAERDLTMAISNLDLLTDEIELSKVYVYLRAPRTFELDGWHPRPSAAKVLDTLIRYPQVDSLASSKLAKMNASVVNVKLANKDPPQEDHHAGDYLWLEWDGKLMGVE
ncbi:hypothetical protein M408DRAFT_330515 [Serendipita vermifera MAFF 305830]|uniref:Uncharacterized protein n=1 Tax=Serendipita vermifera MAFF 305830 TaxID=933852 RepID=A0A0C3B2Y9_SERVB|nr:hypothetical protein M408DRAFT_330515 [Serendipita vermifera MAFF 305830]